MHNLTYFISTNHGYPWFVDPKEPRLLSPEQLGATIVTHRLSFYHISRQNRCIHRLPFLPLRIRLPVSRFVISASRFFPNLTLYLIDATRSSVYLHVKPGTHAILVDVLSNACEDTFFTILNTLDIIATTLWSWPQLLPQQEPTSILFTLKVAYKAIRGHSFSSNQARKVFGWLPETVSRRLVSRECYYRRFVTFSRSFIVH